MKKYLFIALAAMGFAACESAQENATPGQNGELEQSYVAITLAADDLNTRANDGKYEAGTVEERAVKSAYVFFFEDGVAFPVAFDGTTSTNAGPKNYLKVELPDNGNQMPNVSDVKDAVLVLQNYKGEYPNQMVAVLNWTPSASVGLYSLADLKNAVSALGSDANGYVMSNAVYANKKNEVVDAVTLTIENIHKDADNALANPVKIYVERVAAKVVFTSKNEGKFEVGTVNDTVDNTETVVYAKIKGFELFNDYENSYLIKRINPAWEVGFNWNDADWHRSYWATSLAEEFPANTFAWYTDDTALNAHIYCGENTRAWTADNDLRTKVIVKAELVKEDNSTVEVVNWYGKDYIGEGNLLKVVANTLKNTYFASTDGASFTGLTPADIKCVDRLVTDSKAYEVYFQLSDAGAAKTWYKYSANNYEAVSVENLNLALGAVQPALVYKNGMTYYWLDIKHLGATGSTAEYGIVRNHVYKVNISGITGYGTPVYNGNTAFITPEKPQEVKSYVSAQINILSWRVVENNYDI